MAIKKFKPATPGTRFRVGANFSVLTPGKPVKSLTKGKHTTGGRNSQGRMTVRNVGGGHKRRLRDVDFKRHKEQVPAVVKSIEYDPNRTAFIALLYYADGDKRYILAPRGLKVGDELITDSKKVPTQPGNCMPLKAIPLGTTVHNVELTPGKGGQMARSAGTFAQLTAKEGKYGILKLPSGETRMVLLTCKATVGTLSNADHVLQSQGKAGRNRWRGRRPRTRGVAMNPVDHPMGGGEGKASGGHPRSRKGLYAKGKKTRNPRKKSSRLIVQRKKKKKRK